MAVLDRKFLSEKYKNKQLEELKHIDLSEHNIERIDRSAFEGLTDLETLSLKNNKISTIADFLFESLENLVRLDLSNNRLYEVNDSTFKGLANLQRLELNNNNLETIYPYSFAPLQSLKRLRLSYNKLKEIHPNRFGELSELETLYLDNNQLEKLIAEPFEDLPALKNLYLNRNKLNSIETYTFNGLVGLKILDLNDNELKYMCENWLECLNSLDELNLWNINFKHNKLRKLKRKSTEIVDCPFCKEFISKNKLKEHLIRYHSMLETMTCSNRECHESKEALIATKNHIKEMENQLKAQFHCPICLGVVMKNDAKTLQCGHVMHATCQDRLTKEIYGNQTYIKCPKCRQMSWPIKLY